MTFSDDWSERWRSEQEEFRKEVCHMSLDRNYMEIILVG